MTGLQTSTQISISNTDADVYIISNADDEDNNNITNKDDGKVEIIMDDNLSDEDKAEESDEDLFDGSGNGGELVELDGLMPAENRQVEEASQTIQENNQIYNSKNEVRKKEKLEEMLHTIKNKSEVGQPSSNIDPNLTAQLQRLSQLIDGLKQTYQTSDTKQQNALDSLRPDQLNAFLAHFNIKNKFDTLDPSESLTPNSTITATTTPKPNRTLNYKQDATSKLNPETKVVLSNILPHGYSLNKHENSNSGGGYSNSQIVVNRPEGSVLFSLPTEHHFVERPEYSPVNAPKISEETLKTVLELSKQMIAQQNVPKIIPNPTYYASPIMQPILLTPQVDSPFSTNYLPPQNSNGFSFKGHSPFSGVGYNQNYKFKKPSKRPHHNGSNNKYKGSSNDDKTSTTIIHNNVIPVHVSTTNSGEKEILDSYGHSLGLYPVHHEERPSTNNDYYGNSNSNSNSPYSSNYQSSEHSSQTTERPLYVTMSTTTSSYSTTPRPFSYHPTDSTINQYFTPSEHLGDHNVNNVFPTVDNFGTIPRPMKKKKPNQQIYKPTDSNDDSYTPVNQLFPQLNNRNVHIRPNSQDFNSMESNNDDELNNYQEDNNDDESQVVTYTYGRKKRPTTQLSKFENYAQSSPHSSFNSIFSSNNQYLSRPDTKTPNMMTLSNSQSSVGKNKYSPISSPISSAYADGTQLVNVGGNFISFDVFQNSILPMMGGNPESLSSGLNNIEVITCATGVRQPNTTDCTRYYVCSKKDGKVLSYSCPPYTAFNSEARICDARTYAMCTPNAPTPTYSVSENKRIQLETLKALQEANRRQMLQQQQQTIKAQNFANLLQQYNSPSNPSYTSLSSPQNQDSSEQNMLNSYLQQSATMGQSFATTSRPQIATPTVKKRKYYCKEGDKIADQTSINNYFVCYKNAQGQMKGHKMTCSKSLLFCPKITMCTLPSKCS